MCGRGGRTAPVVRSSVSPSSRSREGGRTRVKKLEESPPERGLLSGPAGWWASAHPPGRQTHHKRNGGQRRRAGVPRRTPVSTYGVGAGATYGGSQSPELSTYACAGGGRVAQVVRSSVPKHTDRGRARPRSLATTATRDVPPTSSRHRRSCPRCRERTGRVRAANVRARVRENENAAARGGPSFQRGGGSPRVTLPFLPIETSGPKRASAGRRKGARGGETY